MVRAAAVGAALALGLVTIGCGASATPAPQSQAPIESSPAGSASDDSGLTPPPGGGTGIQLTVRALNIAFEPVELEAPAGQPITVTLENKDEGIPHNWALHGVDGPPLVKTEIVTGLARAAVTFQVPNAGAYNFTCEVHPNMTGTLTITP